MASTISFNVLVYALSFTLIFKWFMNKVRSY
jgi:hypothetical protein